MMPSPPESEDLRHKDNSKLEIARDHGLAQRRLDVFGAMLLSRRSSYPLLTQGLETVLCSREERIPGP
ncbi:hypothetical protein Tco_0755010 [Tanacetum coccineum]